MRGRPSDSIIRLLDRNVCLLRVPKTNRATTSSATAASGRRKRGLANKIGPIIVDPEKPPTDPTDAINEIWGLVLNRKVFFKLKDRAKRQGVTVHELMRDVVPSGYLKVGTKTLTILHAKSGKVTIRD